MYSGHCTPTSKYAKKKNMDLQGGVATNLFVGLSSDSSPFAGAMKHKNYNRQLESPLLIFLLIENGSGALAMASLLHLRPLLPPLQISTPSETESETRLTLIWVSSSAS